MDSDDLAWRVEEACLNAWPAPRQAILGGWLLRAAGGPTRRVNSVNPLRGGPRDPAPLLAGFEALYAGLGQPAIFRVPEIAPGMDVALERAGYTLEGETCTLHAGLDRTGPTAEPDIAMTPEPGEDWLRAWAALNGADDERLRRHRAMTAAILLPRRFAATRHGGEIAAIAYGVLHDGLLVVESVATRPALRRRGLAARTVGALLAWAAGQGARGACLQVEAGNAPARALYRRLGFETELYRYHYRRQPGRPG